MKRFHISISVSDFAASVADYSARLSCTPCVVENGRYALWRTDILNFSISCKQGQETGVIRHIGFEDDTATGIREEQDVNGIIWETFSKEAQAKETADKFPNAKLLKN